MKPNVLVKNKKYEGKYVAMPSFNDRKVIASGKDATKVFERASQKGYNTPVILYAPKKDEIFIL